MRCTVLFAALAVWIGCASYDPVSMDPPGSEPDFPARLDEIALASEGASLNGILYVAEGPGPHPTAILLHGFPGNERNLDLAQALRRGGWNVLFFHYRGAWGSQGDFSFANAVVDVRNVYAEAASDPFATRHLVDPERVVLIGHSMGGFMALAAGAGLPGVRCIVSLAGANLGALGAVPEEQAPAVEQALAGWMGPIRGTTAAALVAEVRADPARFDTRRMAPELATRPLLLVTATRDADTPRAVHHDPLVEALHGAGAERLGVTVLETDHSFSDRRIALTRTVLAFLDAECR